MLRIGIQGQKGSTNERAALHFAKNQDWKEFEILPLHTTLAVLAALHEGSVQYGTFAWESSRAGLVKETQEAALKYSFHKLDEVTLEIDHALLGLNDVDITSCTSIYSHPQALKEHRSFLTERLPAATLYEELDTALAAEKLSKGEYTANSMTIAPLGCAEIYGLSVVLSDLPSNRGYWTKIILASAQESLIFK